MEWDCARSKVQGGDRKFDKGGWVNVTQSVLSRSIGQPVSAAADEDVDVVVSKVRRGKREPGQWASASASGRAG